MNESALEYVPAWYHVGNADLPALAVAYGIVAMATVWMFEAIVALVLYDTGAHIALTDVGALVCHGGGSWRDLAKWARGARGQRASRRAYAAVVLRLLVTLVDVVIIILAVPRTMYVGERDVGMSQLNLQGVGEQLLPGKKYTGVVPNPCIWERVKFKGFSPEAALLICTNAMDEAEVDLAANSSTAFVLRYNTTFQRLEFHTTPDNRPFYLTHNLFIPATDDRTAPLTFNLPMPTDIEAQAARVIVDNTDCTGAGMTFTCRRRGGGLGKEILGAVLENVHTGSNKGGPPTRKVQANRNYTVNDEYVELGSMNRPLLCIYPALILLALLAIVYFTLKLLLRGAGESIEVKLFNLVAEATDPRVGNNPLVATDKVLPSAWPSGTASSDI